MHQMNPPIVRGRRAYASCSCGWGEWVGGVKLDPTDQRENFHVPAEDAWVGHMEIASGRR